MCGIVGCAGSLEYRDKEALTILMHLCELRGEDSTGIFTVAKDSREALMHKVVGGTRMMFDTTRWDKMSMFNERVVVGHCRKATVGKVSRSTAHPFNYGDITGVHNGTLRNWRWLLDKEEETDSMTLYKRIAERGIRDSIEATDGAYALVWWNEAEETLNFLRNKERPLFYCYSKDFKRIFWASEAWMLHIALAKAGIEMGDLTPREKTSTEVLPLEEDTWWRVKVGRRGDKDPLTFLEDHDEALKGGVAPAKYQAAPFQGVVRSPFEVGKPSPNASGAPGLQESQSGTTQNQGGSTTTNSSSCATSTTASEFTTKGSQPSRPMLSLVQGSKNDGCGDSCNGNHKPREHADIVTVNGQPAIVGYNGLTMEKKEFEVWMDPNCFWCQRGFSFEEILENPTIIGEWMDDEEHLICANCMDNDCLRAYLC